MNEGIRSEFSSEKAIGEVISKFMEEHGLEVGPKKKVKQLANSEIPQSASELDKVSRLRLVLTSGLQTQQRLLSLVLYFERYWLLELRKLHIAKP